MQATNIQEDLQMKKAMLFALILVLALTLLAGCRDKMDGGTNSTAGTNGDARILPDGNNGTISDGDGIIDDGMDLNRNSRTTHY